MGNLKTPDLVGAPGVAGGLQKLPNYQFTQLPNVFTQLPNVFTLVLQSLRPERYKERCGPGGNALWWRRYRRLEKRRR